MSNDLYKIELILYKESGEIFLESLPQSKQEAEKQFCELSKAIALQPAVLTFETTVIVDPFHRVSTVTLKKVNDADISWD